MIFGIGIDNIEVKRIKKQIDDSVKFKDKIYTLDEIKYCESKRNYAESFAVRFAAKEAFLKAIGTGWSDGLQFNDIEILNDKNGKPKVHLYGKAKQLMVDNDFCNIQISMSHLTEIATAIVIIEIKK
ncbi:MAG: holo-ACP synthase [Candidatus Tenebribacter davisii]|jgi:holo-[acyl-carrier protein] synthase|nr:holo-ACP synthase [Candidatus Tenebribacter davisii]